MYWHRIEQLIGRNSIVGTIKWYDKADVPSVIIDPIKKLRENIGVYRVAYDHPKAHRTSNMVDRLMQRMDRHLYSTQYFHGSMDAAQLSIRGWTLIFRHTIPERLNFTMDLKVRRNG